MKYSYGQYFVGKNVPAHLEQFFKSLDSSHLKKKLMHLKGSKHKKGKITQSLLTSEFLFNYDGQRTRDWRFVCKKKKLSCI